MTGFVIAKFGGSSVADYDSMNCSANVVVSNPSIRLVVLSASSGVTDLLLKLSEGLEVTERFIKINTLRKVQLEILKKIENSNSTYKAIDRILNNIRFLAEKAYFSTSAELTDELISYGELMSTLIFVEVLRKRNIQAQWFDVRNVMQTNNRFGCAEPDITALEKLSVEKLIPRLSDGLVITQGFIGIEYSGRTTTLGRGGSDYTATLLGEAIHASRVDIWTDVPGIYTTDPRVVPAAKRIDGIAFEEAAEMAIFGAKVLHPSALLPAIRKNIPVFIGSSKDPKAGGTLVVKKASDFPMFRALTLRRKQTLLTLYKLNMMNPKNFFPKLIDILARYDVSINLIDSSEASISMMVDTTVFSYKNSVLTSQNLLSDLSDLYCVKVEENLALVTVIGNQLTPSCILVKKTSNFLSSFNVRMIFCGASNYNLSFLVPGAEAEKVLQKLHSYLFNQ